MSSCDNVVSEEGDAALPSLGHGRRLVVVHVVGASGMSGGAVQAIALSRGIRDAGHRVVFCPPRDSDVSRHAVEAGLDVVPLEYKGLRQQWRSSRKLRHIVRDVGASLVHTHHTPGHNVGAMATFGGPFVPVVVKRGVLFDPKFALKFRTPRVSAIITNTEAVKRVLTSHGVSGDKVRVIYNAKGLPDLETLDAAGPGLRTELDLPVGRPVIGTAGNAREEKGFQYLVEAAPRILEERPDALFVLVGGGTERFLPRLKELGVSDRFRMPGGRADILEVMALFDLFVFPGVHMDSCANVLLEAMSVGLPVVGSDMRGMSEVIEEGAGTGVLFKARDPEALAAGVLDVLSDPVSARLMGRRSRDAVTTRFNLEGRVGETLRVYEEVLGYGVYGAGTRAV